MLVNRFIIVIFCLGLFNSVNAAESYKELSHQYDLVFQQFLQEKIEKLPKNVIVKVFLKHQKTVVGKFEGFSKYGDSFWILPNGKCGLFADEAYDISEIQDVRIVILRNI